MQQKRNRNIPFESFHCVLCKCLKEFIPFKIKRKSPRFDLFYGKRICPVVQVVQVISYSNKNIFFYDQLVDKDQNLPIFQRCQVSVRSFFLSSKHRARGHETDQHSSLDETLLTAPWRTKMFFLLQVKVTICKIIQTNSKTVNMLTWKSPPQRSSSKSFGFFSLFQGLTSLGS